MALTLSPLSCFCPLVDTQHTGAYIYIYINAQVLTAGVFNNNNNKNNNNNNNNNNNKFIRRC
jgi:hypothetical protein